MYPVLAYKAAAVPMAASASSANCHKLARRNPSPSMKLKASKKSSGCTAGPFAAVANST